MSTPRMTAPKLSKALDNMTLERDALQEEVESLNRQLQKADKAISDAYSVAEAYKNEIDLKSAAIAELQQQVESSGALQQTVDSLEDRIQRLMKAVADSDDQIKRLQADCNATSTMVAQRDDEILELKEKLSQAEIRLKNVRSDCDDALARSKAEIMRGDAYRDSLKLLTDAIGQRPSS